MSGFWSNRRIYSGRKHAVVELRRRTTFIALGLGIVCVALAVIIGLALFDTAITGTGPGYSVNGSITVRQGTGDGTLTVEVHDDSGSGLSITSITVTSHGLDSSVTIPDLANFSLSYGGSLVSKANPLVAGQSAVGSVDASNLTAGGTYQVKVMMTYGSRPGEGIETISITAQL
jgi:hypothetical protein